MAFVNASLLFGVVMVGIPIVLHLAMRRKPKLIEFPALQFVRQRRESNQRQLQLKHLLLLLLRVLAILCLAFALARPSVDRNSLGNWLVVGLLSFAVLMTGLSALAVYVYQRGKGLMIGLATLAGLLLIADLWMVSEATAMTETGLIGNHQAPVAAVIVIDSSARMDYENENETRLAKAKEMASWLIRQLPDDSEVAVIDSRAQRRVFSVDLAAAQQTLDLLEISYVAQPMPELILEGIELAAKSEKSRKEVYVFSDLTAVAWQSDKLRDLQTGLQEAGSPSMYVIDVGVDEPTNFAIGDLVIPQSTVTRNRKVVISTELVRIGQGDSRTVELLMEKIDPSLPVIENGKALFPEAIPRHRELCSMSESNVKSISFAVDGLEIGVHHGLIRIVGDDGLRIDDRRYFTIEVQDAWPVLVVTGDGATEEFLTAAIAPYQEGQQGAARFACEVIREGELGSAKLSDYAAVFLLDPGPLPEEEWERMQRFVNQGGGLAICLGRNARSDQAFHNEVTAGLIGGRLSIQWRSPSDFLEHRSNQHPILSIFGSSAAEVPWEYFPVRRHWGLDPIQDGVRTVIQFANDNQPAVLEHELGRGRIMTITTPISDPANVRNRAPWNELATGESAWPFVGLMRGIASYLVNSTNSRFNFRSGETVQLANDARVDPEKYSFFTPAGEVQQIVAVDDVLSIRTAEAPGTYRLKGDRGGVVLRGFSVNVGQADTDLTRVGRAELEEVFGETTFQLARSQDEIVFGVREQRVGKEFYSHLLLLAVLFLAMEHLLANRFYKSRSAPADPGQSWLRQWAARGSS